MSESTKEGLTFKVDWYNAENSTEFYIIGSCTNKNIFGLCRLDW